MGLNLYYPYGSPTRRNYDDRYMYSGKELDDMNGLRLYDFSARSYDAIITRFLSPDPMRSKYPHISPYAYCAGNPIMFIDPTGMEIWINDIMYSIGMSYDGNNEFIKNTIMALNTIADNGGNKLISDLIDSSKKYDYLLTSNSNSHTVQLENGDVEIRISSSNITDQNSFFSAVAHESMHGVQYENGQGGASIFNEVEAYVFEATIATNSQLDNHPNKFHVNIPASEEGVSTVYEKAFSQLLWNGYAPKSMMDAVTHFKTEASANNTGLYNKYRLYINAPFDSILKKYNINIP